uniref:Rab-GAP TBC domain-containing protein n=1 Tax=Falco tinnunculus TaxID=100819 RepID=A0A8C4UBM7_FALTI
MPSADRAHGGGCWAVFLPSLHLSIPGVSLQAAGPVSGAEGIHAVPPRGRLLPGPGPHRCCPAHAHASRGMGTCLGGQGELVATELEPGGGVGLWGGQSAWLTAPIYPRAWPVQGGVHCPRYTLPPPAHSLGPWERGGGCRDVPWAHLGAHPLSLGLQQAFWCLVQICEKYLPGYYSEKLEAIQLDGQILFSLLHKVSPVAYKHLSKQKIDPILYMTEWFMCAFSRTLPWSSVLRVWDMFFCEGVKIIFRVGLVLLKHTLGSSDKLKSCQGQYETMERLRALSPKIMQETFLVQEVIELPVTERQIEREHLIQLKKWRETHGELQCKSPPRLHGAKAISEAEPPTRKALEPVPSIVVSPGPAPVPKARKSKEKSREKGPASPANGPGAEGNGAPGSARELLQPQVSPHHQSKESLSSRESEDTYL